MPEQQHVCPYAAALSDDDRLVLHLTSVGLLVVDAAAKTAPTIELLLGAGAADCCAATALTVAHGVAVASVPDGTVDPPWCHCQGSRLFGVKLPPPAGRA